MFEGGRRNQPPAADGFFAHFGGLEGPLFEPGDDVKELVVYLATALAEQPEKVTALASDGENGALNLELTVADADLNRIIGKQGRTVKAMRTLLAAAAAKSGGRRAFLKVKGGEPSQAEAGGEASSGEPELENAAEPAPGEEASHD